MPGIFDIKNPNRKGWKTYRFDQISRSISERVEPKQTELEIYVGLEHIDPQSLHIKRWGTPADVEGIKLKVYPGDLIFGKRRAYQRKAAIANFEGICSAHAMVLRANPDVIDPKLFPFFIHSDAFMQRAMDISVGSLSPTINWGTLKTQEFLLPPIEQQAKLAELLWAADDVVEAYREVERELRTAYENKLHEVFKYDTELIGIEETCKVNSQSLKSNTDSSYEFYYLDIASIVEPKKVGELEKLQFHKAPSRARRVVNDGDIVLSLVRPYFKSFVVVENAMDVIASTGTAVLTVNDNFNKDYIFHSFFSKEFETFCEVRMNGTNYPAITANDVKDFKIPHKTLAEQKRIGDILNSIDTSVIEAKNQIKCSQHLQHQLINSIF